MAKILLLHGPNLNLLGTREPETYGHATLTSIVGDLAAIAQENGHELQSFQSNAEHALIDRILFLGGHPNVQRLNPVLIGQSVLEVLQCDQKLEEKAIADLREAIAYCESVRDFVSRDLFASILRDEEKHADFVDRMVERGYTERQVRRLVEWYMRVNKAG